MTGTDAPLPFDPKPATATTAAANAAVAVALPLGDGADRELATRGRIAGGSVRQIPGGLGVAWDLDAWGFLDGPCPDTVNPSLWRQSQLCAIEGLFEVTDGIWQVRGFDLSNVTFVAGERGWIVIDPLTSTETARAALDLVTQHLGERPVTAVIYTHSHIDHFAGVRGVVDEADVVAGRVPVIAPAGFLRAAVSENVIAGNAMARRATYMYGMLLGRGPQGLVGSGLGQTTPLATTSLIDPTVSIDATGTELVVDGVRFEFQLTPGTEAPAEMNFLLPDHRALCMAENCSAVQHNVYTPRGAEVRDALAWATYLDESIERFVDRCDLSFASHHWPRWGAEAVAHHLASQRDTYRYLHDQTMRLANRGLTPIEIAEEVELPAVLGDEFFNRGYYGTVNHNVKAVYQKYLGWFDANPAHLHPLPPVEAGRRYVEFMGGADALLERARASFDAGEYRWVAQVVDHLVFAEPDHTEARALQADALEQLGYAAESGPWRSFYLTGAQELRHGPPPFEVRDRNQPEVMAAMSVDQLLCFLGVHLDGPRAADVDLAFTLVVVDAVGEPSTWAVAVRRGVVQHTPGRPHPDAELTIRTSRAALADALAAVEPTRLVAADGVELHGRVELLAELGALLDHFEFFFPIVTP
jgi:alkyl sulfatase BDS1-like metallo-beta-lactamase superfamily hydrolase